MIEGVWILFALLIVIEIGYQLVNFIIRQANNIPIPGSKEEE